MECGLEINLIKLQQVCSVKHTLELVAWRSQFKKTQLICVKKHKASKNSEQLRKTVDD